jgi:putative Mg2+ transporter-C (MgtC) family protein
MRAMTTSVGWDEIWVRLALALVAGALVGLDRGEHGRPAGLRTMTLVCLAAAASMIEVNLLLGMAGKAKDSYITLDLMRLPLGILSGMGFIGAGAILRRGDRVTGVTTAATLWFVTVMGLCLGGGQLKLGLALLAICLGVLWALKIVEHRMKQDSQAALVLRCAAAGPSEAKIREALAAAGFRIVSCGIIYDPAADLRKMNCRLQWRARRDETDTPGVLKIIAALPGVLRTEWKP